MKSKLLAVLLVVVLITVAVLVIVPGTSQASMIGDVTVYVKEADGPGEMAGSVDLDGVSGSEQFLMFFGSSVRPAEFAGTIAGIYKTANYEMWAVAKMNVKGTGVKSITGTTVAFSGVSGSGTGAVAGENKGTMVTANGLGEVNPIKLTSPLAVLNADTLYDQSGAGKFTYSMWHDAANSAVHRTCKLYGDLLNGARITVSANVQGLGPSNIPVSGWTNATLVVSVTNFLTASITLSVTSMTTSSNAVVLGIMPYVESMMDNQMVRIEVA